METTAGPRRKTLEELVEGLMDALTFKEETETAEPGAARSIHEARRLRQAGDVDGALALLADVDTASDGDEPGAVGLLRVEAVGEAAVR